MSRILIKNGRIWDGKTFCCGDVLTEGSQIIDIGEQITEQADFVYDATGKIVSPGLIDVHVHMKGIAPDTYAIRPEISCFPFGVTAANEAGGVQGDRNLLDSFMVKNTAFVTVEIKENRVQFDSVEQGLQKYENRAIGLKIYFDTKMSEVIDITPLREICDYARKKNLKVMVHCTNSPTSMVEIVRMLSKGDILTHVFHGGTHTCLENEFEIFRIAKEKGVIIDSGFAGYTHVNFDILKRAVEAGCFPDTISTDITCNSVYKRGGRYGMTMCMSMARHMGMSEEDIFKAVTATPAYALGKEKEWGTLQIGKIADIAVFDFTDEAFDLTDRSGNNIQSKQGYRCVLTVSDGQIVHRY